MTTTVTYTEALIRKAILRFWVRFINWHGVLVLTIATGAVFRAFALRAEPHVIYGFLILWVLVVGTAGGVYFTFLKRSLSKFRRMSETTAEITISPDEFRMKSSVGDSRMQWRAIEMVWRFPECWLLFFGKNVFITLPIAAIPLADRELLCAKVRESGGRVA